MKIADLRKDVHFGELLSGSSVAFVMRTAGMFFGYVFTLLVARKFGADIMGVFALSITVLSIASVIGRLGLDTALLKFVAEYSAQGRHDQVNGIYKKTLRIAIPFSVILSIFFYILSPYIAAYGFHNEALTFSFRIVSLAVLPSVLLLINTQALRALKQIKESSFFQNVSNYLFASGFIILLLMISEGRNIPILAYLMALIAGLAVSGILWTRRRGQTIDNYDVMKTRQLLKVSIPMLLSNSMFLLMGWVTILMLGYYRPESDVGIFNVAFKIASLTGIALVSTNTIMGPKIAEFYGRRDIAGMGKSARQSAGLVFWVTLPLACILFLFPGPVMSFFGDEFRAGALVLIILTVGQFVNAAVGPVGLLLQMTGKQVLLQNIMISVTITNIILNIILIPRYGIVGAAISNMVCTFLLNGIPFLYVRYYYGFYTISFASVFFLRNE